MVFPSSSGSADLVCYLPTERRIGARYLAASEGPEPAIQDEQGEELEAQLVNISVGGVGLRMNHKPQRGEILAFDLPCKEAGGTRRYLARIVRVETQGPGTWQVGCSFLRRLSDLELLSLL
jgi:hypothetical protein